MSRRFDRDRLKTSNGEALHTHSGTTLTAVPCVICDAMPSRSSAQLMDVCQRNAARRRRAWGQPETTSHRGSRPKKTASFDHTATPQRAKGGRPRADESSICSERSSPGKKVSLACTSCSRDL